MTPSRSSDDASADANRPGRPQLLLMDEGQWPAGGGGPAGKGAAFPAPPRPSEPAPRRRPRARQDPGAVSDGLAESLAGRPSGHADTPARLRRETDEPQNEALLLVTRGAAEELRMTLSTRELAERLLVKEEDGGDGLTHPRTGLYTLRGLLRRARELGDEADRGSRAIGCVVVTTAAETRAGRRHDGITRRWMARVASEVREADVVGSVGPDAAAVLAPDTGPDEVMRLAQRLIAGAPGEARHEPRLCAGCFAVDDFHAALIEPGELLVRASLAAHQGRSGRRRTAVRFYRAQGSRS